MGGEEALGPSLSPLQKHPLLSSNILIQNGRMAEVQKQSYLLVGHIFLEE